MSLSRGLLIASAAGVVGACATSGTTAGRSTSMVVDRHDSTVVAVFAHPDDETLIAPALARLAREGARVYLVVVTDGRLGAQDWTWARTSL